MRLNFKSIYLSASACLLGALLCSGDGAQASDFHSPRTAALGGAGHAGPMLNDAIYLNPSFSSFLPSYSVGLNYMKFSGPATEPDGSSFFRGHEFNASIQDGRSPFFQAGVGFTRFEDMKAIHFGASRTAIQRLGFGLGGKFLIPNDTSQKQVQDMTFSTTVIASKVLQFAFIVDNLLETSGSKSRGMYREFVLGSKINVQGILLIYFDPHLVPNRPGTASYGHESGLEFTVMQDFFLRLGAFRNSNVPFQGTRGRGYGWGFGWVAPRVSLDYGMSRVLEPLPTTEHVLGMTMYF